MLHHLAAAAQSTSHRIAARDALAEHGQVGLHAEIALSAAHAEAESGHDFIEDQQRAELITQLADTRVEVTRYGARTAFRAKRLKDHGGSPTAKLVEHQQAAKLTEIV